MNKFLTLIFIGALSLSLTSCGDDCEATTFQETIIGEWKTPEFGDADKGSVTFNLDGTGIASEGSVFTASLSGVEYRTFEWTYDAAADDLELEFTGVGQSGLSTVLQVGMFDCDQMDLVLLGSPITLEK